MSKIITASKLNRLWKNGVLNIKQDLDNKIDTVEETLDNRIDILEENVSNTVINKVSTYNDVMANTVEGYLPDALAVKEGFERLGGLRFGTDGDGNYGYYGADGSLIPFKSGSTLKQITIPLENKTQANPTWNVSTMLPVGLESSNISVSIKDTNYYKSWGGDGAVSSWSISSSAYNPSTGELNVDVVCLTSGWDAYNGHTYATLLVCYVEGKNENGGVGELTFKLGSQSGGSDIGGYGHLYLSDVTNFTKMKVLLTDGSICYNKDKEYANLGSATGTINASATEQIIDISSYNSLGLFKSSIGTVTSYATITLC